MKFFLLINVKMPTAVGILTFMSGKNRILGLSQPKKQAEFLLLLYLRVFKISCSAELSMKKSVITSDPDQNAPGAFRVKYPCLFKHA